MFQRFCLNGLDSRSGHGFILLKYKRTQHKIPSYCLVVFILLDRRTWFLSRYVTFQLYIKTIPFTAFFFSFSNTLSKWILFWLVPIFFSFLFLFPFISYQFKSIYSIWFLFFFSYLFDTKWKTAAIMSSCKTEMDGKWKNIFFLLFSPSILSI